MHLQDLEMKTRWKVAAASALCLAMTFIDQTALNVALPTIQHQLHMSTTGLHWIVNAFLLTLTIFLVLGGKLGDHFGKKTIFNMGIGLFAFASFTCALAPNSAVLIISRALQGMGGALMMPNSTAITLSIFPDNMRGKVMGTLLSFTSILLIIGPLVGGLLTQYLSWRYVFWLNIPVAFASIFLMLRYAPNFPQNKTQKIDWVGFSLLTGWLFSFIFALMQSAEYGWHSRLILSYLISSFILFLFFIWHQLKTKNPFIQLKLFTNKVFNIATTIFAVAQMIYIFNVFMPIYLQYVLGYSPLASGALAVPSLLPMLFLARYAGHLRDKYGPRLPLQIGFAFLTLGNAWLAFTLWTYNIYLIFLGMMCFAAAGPFVFGNANTTALSVVPENSRGIASGITACCRQLGATFSMAILGTIIAFQESTPMTLNNSAYTVGLTIAASLTTAWSIICFYLASKLPSKKTIQEQATKIALSELK